MKRIATILLLLVCAAAGAVRWLDVMYYTDLATGDSESAMINKHWEV